MNFLLWFLGRATCRRKVQVGVGYCTILGFSCVFCELKIMENFKGLVYFEDAYYSCINVGYVAMNKSRAASDGESNEQP